MLNPEIIETNIKPNKTENLGNGNWYYNYILQKKVVTYITENNTEKEETIYSYIQVKMAGKPDYKRCVELIIREYITQSQEFDLINSYNKAVLNMLSEEETEKVKSDYLEYLQKVEEIKSKIKEDFKQ